MTWLKIFDASGSWPTDPAACWADGYRVIAGYAGSQSWKTFTPEMLAKWVTPEHPFGIAAMYEGSGREPFASNSADYGTQHALAARAAWRRLGMPDSAAIAYAVDADATMDQIRSNIAAYFRAVAAHDTCKPIAYLENDGADWLAAQGIIAGGFIPAAYSWNSPAVLVTPANASAYTLWTQEHNGVALHGGDVDTGHIRDDAPIWWANGGDDMQLTDTITLINKPDVKYSSTTTDVEHILASTNYYILQTRNLVQQVLGVVADPTKAAAAIAAAVVAALPPAAAGSVSVTDIQAVVHAELGKLSIVEAP